MTTLINTSLKFLVQNFSSTIPYVKNDNPVRFFLLMHGRSGSSLLISLLNSHSKIKCSGEILYRQNKHPYKLIKGLEKYYRWRKGQEIVWGFKAKPEQISKCDITHQSFFNMLIERNTIIISLVRKNVFRSAISVLLASKRGGHYHNNSGITRQFSPVYLNPEQVLAVMRQRQQQKENIASIIANLPMPCLELNYEEHLSDAYRQKETCQTIFDLLKIERQPISSSFKKMTNNKLSDSVENAEEVIKVVSASEFAKYVVDVSI